MIIKHLCIVPFLLFLLQGQAQSISINYDVDTTVFDVAEPLNLWIDFLNTKDDAEGVQYWNTREIEKYGRDSYFLVEKELQFGVDNFLQLLSYANIKVLSVRKMDDYYKITSLMEFAPNEGKSNVQYIFHVYAGMENGTMKLHNALAINTKLLLNSTTVGHIRYHYPKSHEFNIALAKKQDEFLVNLCTQFGVPPKTVDYYFAPTSEEIQRIRGFDFIIGDNGEQIPSGKADPENGIAYSAGLGEYYPHELIHILLDPHYPNCHLWIREGVATYFGMSRGKDLDWHLEKVNKYLLENPEIDLGNMLELRSLDQYTDFRYALGGFIVREAYKKGGYELIKQLMEAGWLDRDFYAGIEEHLGVQRDDIDQWIRGELVGQR